MQRRNNVEHASISKVNKAIKEMPQGVLGALEKVKELNEAELVETEAPRAAIPEIRSLVLFGKNVEDFQIANHTFKISTLTNRQQKELIKRLMKLEPDDRLTEVKALTMSVALISIDDVPVENMYQGSEDLSPEDKKYEVLSEMQSMVVLKLFDCYESLIKKSNDLLNGGDLNSEIKN